MEEPWIAGYEWMFKCECGGTIVQEGMGYSGPPPDYTHKTPENEGEIPITDGNEYTCQWCDREYVVSIKEKS